MGELQSALVRLEIEAKTTIAAQALLDHARRAASGDFPVDRREASSPGLYAWFVLDSGAGQLSKGLGHLIRSGLIYAGQAGAGRSSSTLRTRLGRNHLRGSITGSTFRMTLAAILADQLELVDLGGRTLAFEGESRLSDWMLANLEVAVTAVPDRSTILPLEDAVLAGLDPPLNLQGRTPTPLRRALTELRRRPLGRRPA